MERGHIQSIRIFGDFFAVGDIADIERELIGVKYEKQSVLAVFDRFNTQQYFGNIPAQALAELLVNGSYYN